ncbi:MAG: asparagine--tRNA ligase [bacterium]|jgi:asparaginyl-tRNA synthetase|nr:asparagine--tRNA ligase [Planctomycetota bacterium]HIL52161.1 asparagine--tRNA ligase [Planctomycetota bacterium]
MTSVSTIKRLCEHVGQTVTLKGWLYNKSSKGKLHFLQLRDGSGIAQCVVFKKNVTEETFEAISHLGQESSLEITGEVKADDRAPGGYELGVSAVLILQAVDGYPITPKDHGVDYLLSKRHLWLRSKRQSAIMRVRDAVAFSLRCFFHERDFVNMDSPMFTPNACEGTSELFEVPYFDRKAYLTQSGQLYAEASAMALGRVFTFGPTFRAEKSKTRRHLTEFWMLEPEVAFADLEDVCQLAEDMIVYVISHVLEHCSGELEDLERDRSKLECIQAPFPRMTYDEAAAVLVAHPDSEFTPGEDFGAPDETILSEMHTRPVIITHYPKEVKAFYMKRDPSNEDRVLCVDILGPEGVGEIIGGSQREEDIEVLEERIRIHELPREAFEWYLDLRRFGSVPHAGFGLGLERFVGWIAGVEHVRECIPFPRTIARLEP